MKEYIDKDEIQGKLLKMIAPEIITKEEMTERGVGLYLSVLTIDNLETVTKADICREFVKLCKVKYQQVKSRDMEGYIDIDSIIDDVLAEMESEQ